MASFRSLTANRRPFEEFKLRISKTAADKDEVISTDINLHLFEWSDNIALDRGKGVLRSVEELEAESRGTVRVM
jgi:hypothetical protein